jgi:hypothetical protein
MLEKLENNSLSPTESSILLKSSSVTNKVKKNKNKRVSRKKVETICHNKPEHECKIPCVFVKKQFKNRLGYCSFRYHKLPKYVNKQTKKVLKNKLKELEKDTKDVIEKTEKVDKKSNLLLNAINNVSSVASNLVTSFTTTEKKPKKKEPEVVEPDVEPKVLEPKVLESEVVESEVVEPNTVDISEKVQEEKPETTDSTIEETNEVEISVSEKVPPAPAPAPAPIGDKNQEGIVKQIEDTFSSLNPFGSSSNEPVKERNIPKKQ